MAESARKLFVTHGYLHFARPYSLATVHRKETTIGQQAGEKPLITRPAAVGGTSDQGERPRFAGRRFRPAKKHVRLRGGDHGAARLTERWETPAAAYFFLAGLAAWASSMAAWAAANRATGTRNGEQLT